MSTEKKKKFVRKRNVAVMQPKEGTLRGENPSSGTVCTAEIADDIGREGTRTQRRATFVLEKTPTKTSGHAEKSSSSPSESKKGRSFREEVPVETRKVGTYHPQGGGETMCEKGSRVVYSHPAFN